MEDRRHNLRIFSRKGYLTDATSKGSEEAWKYEKIRVLQKLLTKDQRHENVSLNPREPTISKVVQLNHNQIQITTFPACVNLFMQPAQQIPDLLLQHRLLLSRQFLGRSTRNQTSDSAMIVISCSEDGICAVFVPGHVPRILLERLVGLRAGVDVVLCVWDCEGERDSADADGLVVAGVEGEGAVLYGKCAGKVCRLIKGSVEEVAE